MAILEKLQKFDKFWIGFLAGLALPLALYPLLKPFDPKNLVFISPDYNITLLKLLPMLLSRCIFPNALLFFLLIWSDLEKAAKGVLYVSIFLVAILGLIQLIF
jgi:hypothetical protein